MSAGGPAASAASLWMSHPQPSAAHAVMPSGTSCSHTWLPSLTRHALGHPAALTSASASATYPAIASANIGAPNTVNSSWPTEATPALLGLVVRLTSHDETPLLASR